MKKDFYYSSGDGLTRIHAAEWYPEGEVKSVLQICHGMVEYINRYDEFAGYLTERGFYVTGHDHLGHGESIQGEDYFGFFHEDHGNQYVIGDIHKLREITEQKYPDVPYYMLGHSMGSFLLRQYLTMYSNGLSGAVIMGTGSHGALILNAGQVLCRIVSVFKGWKYRSELINSMSFGSYNKRFEPGETKRDWVTSDKEKRKEYVEDPMCSFVFTVSGYYQLFEGMKVLARRESVGRIRKNLPILFTAGADDPVGNFGKSVTKVYEKYKQAGIEHVDIKLYEGDRHEILNETDRQQVYEDIYNWFRTLS